MTRIKSSHDFHAQPANIEGGQSICSNCNSENTQVCSWCGRCYKCHSGLDTVD